MSVMVALAPLTPRTPSDIFAALALSPTVATGVPSSLPVLHFSPPTASSTSALSPFWPTSAATSASPISSSETQIHLPNIQHRALTSNEAKQLSMLLAQHLFPVRNSSKGLMKEAIDLAEKLHEAGIRWDTKRRVMGMHLRGIWEEGQRLGNVRSVGGHGPMDLYVQGSFLSIAEEPHPLDPMPIPLEVHPATFAALPKLTLQATSFHGDITPNLASMAVAMGAGLGLGMAGTGFATRSFEARGIDQDGEPPLSASSVMDLDDFVPTSGVAPTASQPTSKGGRKKGGWRDRKKQGLKIKVDAKLKSHHRPIPAMTPTSAFAAQLSSRRNTFAFLFNNLPQTSRPHSFKLSFTRALKKGVRKPKQSRPVNDVRAVDYAVADPPKAAGQASSMTDASNTGARSARRVSFGGWEVR